MKTYVFDACALIAFFNQEQGADKVEDVLMMKDCSRLMSVINIYEVCYDAAKSSGIDEGIKLYHEIRKLPISIVRKIGENVLKEAVGFKIGYKLSVADSFALGLAKVNNVMLVTADHHEFDIVEKAKALEFYWLR